MTDYTEFDTALLANLRAGIVTMMGMNVEGTLRTITDKLNLRDKRGMKVPHFRVIDRRLQALRKANKIRYNGKAWEVV